MWDYLVIACWVVFLVVVGVVARAWSPSGAPDVSVLGADALAFSLTVCPVWLYLTASEAGRTHATWGKRRAGLHVVTDLHGGPVSLSRAALRNAVKLLPWQLAHVAVARMILGVDRPVLVVTTYSLSMVLVVTTVIVAWRDPRHRAFHDLVAGTRVVNVRASVGRPLRPAGLLQWSAMDDGHAHWLGRGDPAELLEDLRSRRVNYDRDEPGATWHDDIRRTSLPGERPGGPEPSGSWEIARSLIETYEVAWPALIRGVYRAGEPLRGRDMLLEGRFHGLHFHMGVRVTDVIDETRDDGSRVWGWSYETLEGHLERGRMTYAVVKHLDTGVVEFVTHAISKRTPELGPVLGLGWRLFGRRSQLRFYRGCAERVHRVVTFVRSGRAELPSPVVVNGLVHAPSDAEPRRRDRLAVRRVHPG